MPETYDDLTDQEDVAAVMEEYHGKRILDVGSSSTVGLSEAAPADSDVVHLDRYPEHLHEGREKEEDREYGDAALTERTAADAKRMPFEEDAYDVVYMAHSLNPPTLSQYDEPGGQPNYWEGELGRVLKEGGDLIIQQGALRDLSRDEMLKANGMDHRREAFDDVEKHGSLLIMRGYHPDRDPGEPTPEEKKRIAREAARIKEEHFEYDDSPARHPTDVVEDAIEEGAFDVEE